MKIKTTMSFPIHFAKGPLKLESYLNPLRKIKGIN